MPGFDIGDVSWSNLLLGLALLLGMWLAALPLFTILVPPFYVIAVLLFPLDWWIDRKTMAKYDTDEPFGGIKLFQDTAVEYEESTGSWW